MRSKYVVVRSFMSRVATCRQSYEDNGELGVFCYLPVVYRLPAVYCLDDDLVEDNQTWRGRTWQTFSRTITVGKDPLILLQNSNGMIGPGQ